MTAVVVQAEAIGSHEKITKRFETDPGTPTLVGEALSALFGASVDGHLDRDRSSTLNVAARDNRAYYTAVDATGAVRGTALVTIER